MTDVTQIIDSEDCLTVFAKNAGLLIADIVRALDGSDIRLASVTFSSPSLDDVFIKHTGKISGIIECEYKVCDKLLFVKYRERIQVFIVCFLSKGI